MKTLNWVKILFIALSLVLAFSLVACVSETPVESGSETEESIDEGNGSVADTDKAPAESGSESTPDEETSSETEPAPACAHTECTETAAKAATCTEAGNDAYKICNACEAIIDANGNVISAIPTIAALGHTEVVDAGTPATCTEAGLTDGKHCSVCNEVLVAQTAIDALGHNVVDKAWTAPTTAEEGWEAHKACDRCGKAWTTEDEALEAAPSIDKIVPTTNKYWGYAEIGTVMVSDKVTTTPSADRTYVRFERNASCADIFYLFMEGNTEVTGKYLVLKYRTDHMTSGEIWANTTENGHSNGSANYFGGFNADGKWHIMVVDLSEKIANYVQPDNDGNYTIQWARIDMLNTEASEGYFDIAYIAFTDDLAKVDSIVQDGDNAICPHAVSADSEYTNNGDDHSVECIICGATITEGHYTTSDITWNSESKMYTGTCICGATVEKDMIYKTEAVTDAGSVGSQGNYLVATQQDGGIVRYTANKTSTNTDPTDPYFYPYRYGTAVTGKFMVVKYRLSNKGQNMTMAAPFASSAASGQGGATGKNNDGANDITPTTLYADGEWHYFIVIPRDNNATFTANADGTYSWAYFRVKLSGFAAYDGSCYLEIDEISFADCREAADAYIAKNLPIENLDKSGLGLTSIWTVGAALSRDTDGNLVVSNGAAGTGKNDAGNYKDNYVSFVNTTDFQSYSGRYVVIIAKAHNEHSMINNIYMQDDVAKSYQNFGSFAINEHVGEWVAIIVDSALMLTEDSNLYVLRIDCCEASDTVGDRSITFKSAATYDTLEEAQAAVEAAEVVETYTKLQ